jgi:hypothetical protein
MVFEMKGPGLAVLELLYVPWCVLGLRAAPGGRWRASLRAGLG